MPSGASSSISFLAEGQIEDGGHAGVFPGYGLRRESDAARGHCLFEKKIG